jgi:hypothetical protein
MEILKKAKLIKKSDLSGGYSDRIKEGQVFEEIEFKDWQETGKPFLFTKDKVFWNTSVVES